MSEFEKAQEAAQFVRTQLAGLDTPKVAVICGSGLGGFADSLQSGAVRIPTASIPHFAASTVEGHAGQLVFGRTNNGDKPVICVQGRVHVYEGHPIQRTVFVVRLLKVLGVETLIVTNAAGGINPKLEVGDLVVLNDHINFSGMAGLNPLVGPNDPKWGPRFLPTNNCYTHELRHTFFTVVDEVQSQLSRHVHEGTYTFLVGPTYESAAEVRMLSQIGTDVVGMSSVPEVITAHHCGINAFGLSLVTNKAIYKPPLSGRDPVPSERPEEPNHAEVVEEAAQAARDVQLLIEEFLKRL